jgi:hypothetical protein
MKLFSVNVTGRYFHVGLCLIVLIAGAVASQSGDMLRYGDEEQYHGLALSMLHGQGFVNDDGTPTAFRPPGYPFVLASLYAISEHAVLAKLLNVLLLGALAFLLGVIAARIKPVATPWVPYLVLACPILIYVASVLYPQILGAVLLSSVVLIMTRKNVTLTDFGLAGVIYGLLCLAIPSFLMVLPLFFLYLLLVNWSAVKTAIVQASVLTMAILVVLAPWTIRNYVVFGQLVPVSSIGGLNLMFGNSALTTPNSGVNVDIWTLCPEAAAPPGEMDELVRDNLLKACAIDWIRHNPVAAAQLYVGKVVNYFNYRNEVATRSEAASWRDWLSFFTYYPLLAAAIARLAVARRFPMTREEGLIYILYFGNAFISAVFFTRVRFRIPFDALLIPVVAAFVFGTVPWMARLRDRFNRTAHSEARVQS